MLRALKKLVNLYSGGSRRSRPDQVEIARVVDIERAFEAIVDLAIGTASCPHQMSGQLL